MMLIIQIIVGMTTVGGVTAGILASLIHEEPLRKTQERLDELKRTM